MKHEKSLKLMDQEIAEIEESRKDLYIERYLESLLESLENIEINIRSAMYDAVFIDKLAKSKRKK